jgi:hypothetical protein
VLFGYFSLYNPFSYDMEKYTISVRSLANPNRACSLLLIFFGAHLNIFSLSISK